MNCLTTRVSLLALALLVGHTSAQAASISVNFATGTSLTDNNSVDADETGVVGNPDAVNVAGNRWNNILMGNGGLSSTSPFIQTLNGAGYDLINDSGSVAAKLTSTLSTGFAGTSNISGAADVANGTAGLMDTYLAFNSSSDGGPLTIANLGSDFTAGGYKVVVFFDFGATADRNYGIQVNGITYITRDNQNADSDPTDTGTIVWKRTTATSNNQVNDANYAVFEGLTANSFTIEGIQTAGSRAILSGFQIIANNPVPEPSTYALVVLGGVVWWRCRGKRSAAG